jgi:mono/diheme cytochrome c family protein
MEAAHSQAAHSREQALVDRGKAVYQSTCIACHNANPRVSGSLGPDIWGSSKELLALRVLAAQYPPGYKPKRPTRVMPPFPQHQRDIDALHAYLNSPNP